MKRKTAKDILASSFRELAAIKPIDKIKVKDIADNCGYSTATFYRHFKDKYDLIAWSYSEDLKRIMRRFAYDETSWKETLKEAAWYYSEHREYLENLLRHTAGYDSFVFNMTEIHFNSLKEHIIKAGGGELLDEKMLMLIRMYVHGTVDITCEWILGNFKAGAEELVEVYDMSLPPALRAIK